MVRNDQFQYRFTGIQHADVIGVNNHSGRNFRNTGGCQVPAAFYFHHTNTASTGFVLNIHAVKFHMAKRRNVNPSLTSCLQHGRTFINFNFLIIDGQFYFFHVSFFRFQITDFRHQMSVSVMLSLIFL